MTILQVETMAIPIEPPGTDSLLNEITELAIQIDFLFAKVQQHGDAPRVNLAIQKLASKFDTLYDQAVNKGIPLNTHFQTMDMRGNSYEIFLTEEGVEYRVA